MTFLSIRIIEKNGGRAPLTYHQFQTVIAGMEAPSIAETTITLNNIGKAMTPVNDDHDEKYGVPTLEELGKLRFLNNQRYSKKQFLLLRLKFTYLERLLHDWSKSSLFFYSVYFQDSTQRSYCRQYGLVVKVRPLLVWKGTWREKHGLHLLEDLR